MYSTEWTENVIVADADYVDSVAFDLTVNFERMLERRVPQADMSRWAECVALDGGMRLPDNVPAEGEGAQVQVVLVHRAESTAMKNFTPGHYADELNGRAFHGRLGEFVFTVVQTEAMADKEHLLQDLLDVVCSQTAVKRLMVVVADSMVDSVRPLLQHHDSDARRTTLFTMQPVAGGAYRHVMLGYSLMAALGISGREIEEKLKNGH